MLAAALVMTACDSKTTEQTAGAATQTEAATTIGSGDIAYVQVEAVLAQCDLFLNEGKALQEKTEKAQKAGPSVSRASRPRLPSCRKNTRRG